MPVDIGYGHFWLDLRFADLRETIVLAEELISQNRMEFDTILKRATPHLPDYVLEDLYTEWVKLKDQSPQVLRRALFLVSYGRIEALLNDLCNAAKKDLCLPLSLNDLANGGIVRAKVYLTKVASLCDPFKCAEWELLVGCNQLRNSLIHGVGRPTPEHKKLLSFVEKQPLLSLDEYGYVVIESGFCERVVDAAHRFFEQFPHRLMVEAWHTGTRGRLDDYRDGIQVEVY